MTRGHSYWRFWALALTTTVLFIGEVSGNDFSPEDALAIIQNTRFDSLNFVAVESEENSFLGDAAHISRVCYVDGVWLLEQRDVREHAWDRSGILVKDGVAYFAALDPPELLGGDCVVCHTNGPRALQGPIVDGLRDVMVRLNEQVREDGVVIAYVPPDDPVRPSDRLTLPVCVECHDDVRRSALYGTQVRSMYYQTDRGHMPPEKVMTKAEKLELYGWMRLQVEKLW